MKRELMKTHLALPAVRFSYPGRITSLTAGSCPVFFQADTVMKDKTVHLYCHTEGFQPLKNENFFSAEQCLLILKDLLKCLHHAADWLWMPEELVLSVHTVWKNKQGRMKLLCLPDSHSVPVHRRLFSMAEQLKPFSDETGKAVLERVQTNCFNQSHTVWKMIHILDEMIRQLQEYSQFLLIN